MISAYFAKVKSLLDYYEQMPFVLEIVVSFELRPSQQGYWSGNITFIDGKQLYCREYVDIFDGQESILSYSYHVQEADTTLLFRYDNAAHKPTLPFTEHKHVGLNEIVFASRPPIREVMMEIMATSGWI
ncbi:MAG: DUF6516 family protein [Chloroflexi bacterium]|nr:DUF6516 family protein [Chloroflexota bacterium]